MLARVLYFGIKKTTSKISVSKEQTTSVKGRLSYDLKQMSRVMRKPTFWFLTWSDTNQAVQLQKIARGLKFRIQKEEIMHYLCSKNKVADQLCSNHEADLRLCFRICKLLDFSLRGSNYECIL